jgi:NADP-dependent 3-hydroxy acid dehydrogenase YdfG
MRTILITGASSGIGAALAERLAGPDHHLLLVARRKERLAEVVQAVVAKGGTAHGICANLADVGAPALVVDEAVRLAGGLSAVVNNAGIFETAGIGALNAEHLDRLFSINVQAPMLLTQAALPHLRGRQGGQIVNVSSIAAESAFPGCGAYAATKAAIEAWSRSLREELRGAHVRVSVVAPGATDTEVWPADSTYDRTRMCRAADVAEAIAFVLNAPATASIDRLVVMPPGGPL